MSDQTTSKELIAARVDQLVKEIGLGYIQTFRGEIVGTLIEYTNFLRTAHEPKSDQCEVCSKPLPPVGSWSMPSCPDCQDLLEGLGQLMGDFADREQTIKAGWIERAINLICARPSQPPAPEWQPIETAPKKGEFMVWIPSTDLAWPAHACEDHIYSNAHGLLNEKQDGRALTATHWMSLLSPPPKSGDTP